MYACAYVDKMVLSFTKYSLYMSMKVSVLFSLILERELALKFFSTLSGVKTDKLEMLGQKINHDHRKGRCEISDSGRIEEALHALARYLPWTLNN